MIDNVLRKYQELEKRFELQKEQYLIAKNKYQQIKKEIEKEYSLKNLKEVENELAKIEKELSTLFEEEKTILNKIEELLDESTTL